jgi:uncharacterized membrane protein
MSTGKVQLETMLGMMLHYGTILASVVIVLGLALTLGSAAAGWRVATVGIVLFILLPVARVGVMTFFFLRSGDYRFGSIAALVMAIMLLSFVLGVGCNQEYR